ncbi:MAG: hypothetical protein NC938_01915 [Candidatus Omnitrophica bacterium]|nr:hypothetical protein [Candidatus Omnitrophota bacterium]MCM8790441.1 hypothetical protein [Candidatus Omnitrophota bacterium]
MSAVAGRKARDEKFGRSMGAVSIILLVMIVPLGHCENFQYESHGKRDPFVPLVGVDRPAAGRLEEITSVADIRLEGIATGAGKSMVAILNGEVVKEGDKFGDIEIKKITGRKVSILFGGKPYEMSLTEEEGGIKSGR